MRIRRMMWAVWLLVAAWTCGMAAVGDGNWPGWRGDGSGIGQGKGLPLVWSATEHVAWKTPLPGEGTSSPIVWGNRIFLTAAQEEGKQRLVLCLDATDGHLLWQKALPVDTVSPTYVKTGYAAPTPVTDGTRIYAFFDAPGLVTMDMQGTVLWTRPLGPFKATYGMASSPVVCDDKVIICCDHGGESFIAAFDTASGEQRWRTPRKLGDQFATPLVITHNGKKQIVVNAKTVIAYDPNTGKELWSCRGMMDAVAPSAVYDHGLVYATSGRNGPAMAIDPSGSGDVSETLVKMQVASGGPYVPSPIVYPMLVLPGDDGLLRFIDDHGKQISSLRVKGHFDSSPVAAENHLYWVNENGDTHVVSVAKSAIKAVAVNSLGEKCLASPAIANGRLYIRTEKHLYCIAGDGNAETPVLVKTETATFAELKKRYDEHPAPEGNDVQVRIAVVEAMGALNDPAAIPLLKDAALNDEHWDVSEAAVKALAQYGEAAVPAFQELFKNWRPYFKVVGAEMFGRTKAVAAVPALLQIHTDSSSPVRIASRQALAEIAAANKEQAALVLPALLDGLTDKEGVVRAAAVRCLGVVAAVVGDQRDTVIKALFTATTDRNPLVTTAAEDVLISAYNQPREAVMNDRLLYGEQRKDATVALLHAGPIRMKFQDGELRYLYAGDKEIIRRVYFAVRDSRWDTVMPELSNVQVKSEATSFTVTFDAVCKNDIADFRWSGEITGTPDGKITFRATGKAGTDFKSPRVGINILYGAESLAGQAYELIDAQGAATPGAYPREVKPGLLFTNTQGLRYTTADGLQVSCMMTGKGFGMEDQRNFCDSSYKAFHGFDYPYFDVPKGVERSDTLTIEVKNAKPATVVQGPIRVIIGGALPGVKAPKWLPAENTQKTRSFVELNGKLEQVKDATAVAWAFNPAAHMPDDDTFMENLSSLLDQVRTVRAVAPKATIRIDPINFESPYPRPGSDPRNQGQFAVAWSVAMYCFLTRAGVDEAVFTLEKGPSLTILKALTPAAGSKVLATTFSAPQPSPIQVLALPGVLWVVNTTDQPKKVTIEKLTGTSAIRSTFTATLDGMSIGKEKLSVKNGMVSLDIAPFGVCQVVMGK